MSIAANVGGHTYTARLEGERVEIERDGVWAGWGRWREGRIEDCAAPLGDGVYAAIEAALARADVAAAKGAP